MTWALVVSLARAGAVAGLAVAVATPIARLRCLRLVTASLWALWLVPPLVWAYWLAPTVAVWPVPGREAAGVVVLTLRHVPPAALVLAFLPQPPLDDAARFLARRFSVALRWRGWVHGSGRNALMAAGTVFLLAFQEFELASLLRLESWTVAVFDGYAAGLGIAELSPWVGAAVAVQASVAVWLWRAGRTLGWAEAARRVGGERSGRHVLGLCLWIGLVVAAALSLGMLLAEIGAGLEAVARQGTLRRALMASAVMATVAVVLAWTLLQAPRAVRAVLALLALSGGLALGLGLAEAFAWIETLGVALRDTPVPLVLGWALWVLPLACVLGAVRPRSAGWHVANGLRQGDARQRRVGRRLHWQLSGRYRLAAAGIMLGWLQGEVLLAAVLAPTAATPAALRLYNLMHYGQSSVLAGMVACVVVAAAVPLGIAWILLRGTHRG